MSKMNFLTQFCPNPIKAAVKTVYAQLLYKINRNTLAKYKKTGIIIAI